MNVPVVEGVVTASDGFGIKPIGEVTAEEAKAELEKVKSIDKEAVVKKFKDLFDMAEGDDYIKFYFGKKIENKKVSKADEKFVTNILLNSKDVASVKKSVDEDAAAAKKFLDESKAAMGKDNDAGDLHAYAKAFTTLYNMVTSEANKMRNAQIKAHKAAIAQAKKTVALVCMGKDSSEKPAENKPEEKPAEANESIDFDFEF